MPRKTFIGRRDFLTGVAAGSAAALAGATQAAPSPAPHSAQAPVLPQESDPGGSEIQVMERSGSDFMVDVLKSLEFEYVAANPGSSFRGLHESVINYGGNRAP